MYSFVCPQCGKAFEELLPISKREEGKCPHCGASASRNLKQEGFSSRVAASSEACRFAGECPAGQGGCPGCCHPH